MSVAANPYDSLPAQAFWRSGVAEASPFRPIKLYERKWPINEQDRVATAGSCFAQHISRNMRARNFGVLDVEPAPRGLPVRLHAKFGYGLYSARYGNIYTVAQLLQLAREAAGTWSPSEFIWERDGRYYDAFRPAIELNGFESKDEVRLSRTHHLERVKSLFRSMDVFIFTLGLTESWRLKGDGTVFPMAPGTFAGLFDEEKYEFLNSSYSEIQREMSEFLNLLTELRGGSQPRIILTVSPVPLTATASGDHVLKATTYSKSVLRCIAGDFANDNPNIDYFPSFEIITNLAARGVFYESNLRSVRSDAVENVMRGFFEQHQPSSTGILGPAETPVENSNTKFDFDDDVQCEEAILEAFQR